MRKLWSEFKSFAMSGNMLDLALGFIIGAAFAKIIESLAKNILMQLVAVSLGQPDFTKLSIDVNHGKILYGAFLTDFINFLMLAAVLFVVVKLIVFIGVGRGRTFGRQECPYCNEEVSSAALVCKFCRQQLVDELPSLADARIRLEELNRRKLPLQLSGLSIPGVPGRQSRRNNNDDRNDQGSAVHP